MSWGEIHARGMPWEWLALSSLLPVLLAASGPSVKASVCCDNQGRVSWLCSATPAPAVGMASTAGCAPSGNRAGMEEKQVAMGDWLGPEACMRLVTGRCRQ